MRIDGELSLNPIILVVGVGMAVELLEVDKRAIAYRAAHNLLTIDNWRLQLFHRKLPANVPARHIARFLSFGSQMKYPSGLRSEVGS